MARTLVAGLIVAVVGGLLALFSAGLGLEQIRVGLLGAALGAALGLVPTRTGQGMRLGAFLIGFSLSWIGYALRAGFLPDTAVGRAIAAFLVLALLAVICGLTADRLPLWAGLLGVAALAGAYETVFGIDPTAFTTESVTAATNVLLGAGIGFLVAAVVGEASGMSRPGDPEGGRASVAPLPESPSVEASEVPQ